MKNYRLKKEAVQFFHEKHATAIYPYETWEKLGVDTKALDEVKVPYLTFGHKDGKNSSSLSGWCAENGAHYHFTIYFPSTKFMEHDKFSKGKVIRKLMDKIEDVSERFFIDFANNNEQEE